MRQDSDGGRVFKGRALRREGRQRLKGFAEGDSSPPFGFKSVLFTIFGTENFKKE